MAGVNWMVIEGARLTGALREGWRSRNVSPAASCQGSQALSSSRRPRVPGTDWSNPMTNTMSYKDYAARIEYDDDDGIFTGRIAGIRDGVGFHADTVEGLRTAFHEAVEDYLETCAKVGKKPKSMGRRGFGTRCRLIHSCCSLAKTSRAATGTTPQPLLLRGAGFLVGHVPGRCAADYTCRIRASVFDWHCGSPAPPAGLSAKPPATASASHCAGRPRSRRTPRR